ncbi:hypothetical protein I6F65_00015 [Pseudoalteromonas sp. SWXJZ94C]|uniref:hypothetical protein n=1 Tax=unclassified Pseudoalteromonas TaxID=194690 RepID=UPI0004183F9B|nr:MULTISPECIES: hypothetical protein [unclassified Pseudoalteromonas]MBH0055340.1 hypothetical protein [Pseudoalteromonas sp. SWXJZ94C]
MRIIKILVWLNLISFILMPLFRYCFYNSMYLEPNEPYGIADVIELFLGFWFMFVIFISVIISLYLMVKKHPNRKKQSGFLIMFCLALVMLADPLRSLAARLAI